MKTLRWCTRIVVCMAGVWAVAPGGSAAHAQSYTEQVWEQLQAHHRLVAELGDFSLINYIIGKLDDDAADHWTFTFSSADDYVITAACDNDCSDIDITVTDSEGTVLVRDTEEDDAPLVRFAPPTTGPCTVEVKMYACSSEPCYFGFGVFSK